MSRTSLDPDDDLPAEAARRRDELVEWLAADPLPDLRDPEVMGRA